MHWTYDEAMEFLRVPENTHQLKRSKHGLERENLRVDLQGNIADTPHPLSLGSALTHPYICTDFSESQLELVTPPFVKQRATVHYMEEVQRFVAQNLKNEFLWAGSMPGRLPADDEIPLAYYGTCDIGQNKNIYRRGIALRYGIRMQMISGTHYNFSFGQQFWRSLHEKFADKLEDFILFRSNTYFRIIRNFLRMGWLNTYLFGATPAVDRSFHEADDKALDLLDPETTYAPEGTSLRMSPFGYYSKIQSQYAISVNDIMTYLRDMRYALRTSKEEYRQLGIYRDGQRIQLNHNILQDEAEHYSRIRPKQVVKAGERALQALRRRGVHYIEVRSLDIDPYLPSGLGMDQLRFIHLFMIYCLTKESPDIRVRENNELVQNQSDVALYGRKKDLSLYRDGKATTVRDWGLEMINEMRPIAAMLDEVYPKGKYQENLSQQEEKLNNPELTPSAKILADMQERKESHQEFTFRLSKEHHQTLLNQKPNEQIRETLEKEVSLSISKQEEMELYSEFILDEYKDLELSTQVLIRGCKKRGVEVEVLDRKENFLRLTRGDKVEYVKEATKTSKDTYITALLMENKVVTKQILRENGISVPQGGAYTDLALALEDYPLYRDRHLVVKPSNTNFGIAIFFIGPNQRHKYEEALRSAFRHDATVLVEEFCPGEEYRFLVINNKVCGIVKRVPANVIGDGKHSIEELAQIKNHDPRSYKTPKTFIHIGKYEREFLATQELSPHSVPATGQQVFLRRNSNVSTGGDALDMTDFMDPTYKDIAIHEAGSVNAGFCGLDMMIPDIRVPATLENYAIVELNFNPVLFFHNYPYQGINRHVEEEVLDFLGFEKALVTR